MNKLNPLEPITIHYSETRNLEVAQPSVDLKITFSQGDVSLYIVTRCADHPVTIETAKEGLFNGIRRVVFPDWPVFTQADFDENDAIVETYAKNHEKWCEEHPI